MNIPEPHEVDSLEKAEQVISAIQQAAKDLVLKAREYGIVVTIETEPVKPLAMGHYDMVVTTRPGHDIYRNQS
jgi:hypothetical protein